MKALLMKKHPKWVALENRVHALSVRERAILLGLLVTLVVGVADQLWISKGFKQLLDLQTQIQQARHSIVLNQDQVMILAEQRARDPDQSLHTEITTLSERKTSLDAEIEKISGAFVSPARMPKVLGNLLQTHAGLHLLSVEAMPVTEVSMGTGEQAVKLYQHSVKMKFTGSFVGLRDYLRDIEGLDQSLVWDYLQFSVATYPGGEIELVVKTLGTGKEFIGVYR